MESEKYCPECGNIMNPIWMKPVYVQSTGKIINTIFYECYYCGCVRSYPKKKKVSKNG